MTYVVMDNRIYGLTKGQFSPTSREGFETSSSPEGTNQQPVDPLALAFAANGSFIAQSFSSDPRRHTEILEQAIEHDGFSYVNVFSPCVTFNAVDTYDYFRDALVDVADTDHDPTDRDAAADLIMDSETTYQGVLYQDDSRASYGERKGITEPMVDIPDGAPEGAMDLVREFY
jgi:2-oxoglutarate ferredoxin oxidoreductase subunit beta